MIIIIVSFLCVSSAHIFFSNTQALEPIAMANLVRQVFLILIEISTLLPFVRGYYNWPTCSAFYGFPMVSDCRTLLWATRSVRQGTEAGFAYRDYIWHLYISQTTIRPTGPFAFNIDDARWRSRVYLPIFAGNGTVSLLNLTLVRNTADYSSWGASAGCKLAVIPRSLPSLQAAQTSWPAISDCTSRYLSLAREATRVLDECIGLGPNYGPGGWKLLSKMCSKHNPPACFSARNSRARTQARNQI